MPEGESLWSSHSVEALLPSGSRQSTL
jgi:hypothetical protein